MNMTKSPINSVTSHSIAAIRSRAGEHLNQIVSNRSEIRIINQDKAVDEDDLLAQIGYKQELNRSYNSLQVFGIAFSIMGLLPSIASTLATGLEAGPVGLTWGWLISGLFILCIGTLMSILSSLIPTSGGLYYWTNYYAPDLIRTPLSFIIGCSNSLALCGGICLINYGFATELLSAIYINRDGNFEITNARIYGVFAACVVSHVIVCCATTKHTASLQTFSIFINVFIIILFFIAIPVGVSRNFEFNGAKFIFTKIDNFRTWDQGWSFMLSWMPAIWTIGAYDSCLHLSEEALNPRKSVPIGILCSIFVCWIVGWLICIVACVAIKDGDVRSVLESSTGLAMAQIIYDALGKSWAVAFMSLIAFAQYLMGASILIAASRQVWAFARDDGLPFFHNLVKVINPKIKVPVRATIFSGCLSLILGLLILIDSTAANALFSLAVAGNYLAWGMPVLLVLLPIGRSRFTPGPFYLGKFWTEIIHITTVSWIGYVIMMCMFPDNKSVSSETMNYTCVINVGIWFLSLVYYFTYGYKKFSGPKSNIDEDKDSLVDTTVIQNVDEVLSKKA